MDNIKRNIKIAWSFGIGSIFFLLFIAFLLSNPYPSDDELIERFNQQRGKFFNLIKTINGDKQITIIKNNGDYIILGGAKKPEDWQIKQYQEVLDELGILEFRRSNDQTLYFEVWKSEGYIMGGKYKRLCF